MAIVYLHKINHLILPSNCWSSTLGCNINVIESNLFVYFLNKKLLNLKTCGDWTNESIDLFIAGINLNSSSLEFKILRVENAHQGPGKKQTIQFPVYSADIIF
jgi:hypothetical protein